MDRPLRFCMITTFYPPYNFGGDGIYVRRLTNALAQRGHHVEVIHCRDAYRLIAGDEPTATYDDHPNVVVHGLKSPVGFLSPLATQQSGYPLFKSGQIRRVLAKRFDVIHYHNISLVGGPKILEYGQGIKLYTPHEYWLGCQTSMLFKFNRAVCTQPHCLPCVLLHKRPPQWWRYSGLLKRAIKHVDALIAPSRCSQDIHRQMNLGVPIVHIPHFVPPPDAAAPTRLRDTPTSPYFLFVGRLEKLKGLQTLIPVFRRYRKAQLWIAGSGTHEARLRQLAAGSDTIRFLGYQSERALQALYRQAVAIIVPSIWFEVFGLVVLEAFRQGTPAIVSNRGGMSELIEESGGGFVYNTEAELTAALDQLLTTPSLRQRLSRCAYQAYQEKWTVDTHVQQYLTLVRDLQARQSLSFEPESAGFSGRLVEP